MRGGSASRHIERPKDFWSSANSPAWARSLDRRPQLAAALAAARAAKCPVVVATLDRLSRDVAFVSGLMSQRIPFIVAELAPMPIHSCFTSMRR